MKKITYYFMLAALLIMGITFSDSKAEAAGVKEIPLKNWTNIKKYDVTGDGKKDTVRIDCDKPDDYNEGWGEDWKISVNGKVVFRDNNKNFTADLTVGLYQINSETVYFDIQANAGANDDICSRAFYQYQGERLKKVCDVYTPIIKHTYAFHFYVTGVNVTEKKITASYLNQFSATGYMGWEVTFQKKGGTWKKTGDTYNVSKNYAKKNWTVNRKFMLYQSPGGTRKLVQLTKGQKVKIQKICLKNNKTYLQVVLSDGKKGWFKSPNKMLPEGYYFKGVSFAG